MDQIGSLLRRFTVVSCLALAAALAPAQTKPTFEVASIRPAAPLDRAKLMAAIQNGETPRLGARVDGARAEYIYVTLQDLILMAYNVKPYQITGPDWLASQRFDIFAKLPNGASKDDAPRMLQALLEDRFKMALHRESREHPMLALVVGKEGPKMKASPANSPGDRRRRPPQARRKADRQPGWADSHDSRQGRHFRNDKHGSERHPEHQHGRGQAVDTH